jgi:type I restriction enzyme R subunit
VIGPAAVGSRVAEPVSEYLSSIVKLLNERFGTEFTQADQLFFEQIAEQATGNEDLVQSARVNGLENFRYAFDRELEGLFIDRMDQNEAIFTRYMDDPEFKRAVSRALAKEVWSQVRAAAGDSSMVSEVPPDEPTPVRSMIP